MTEKLRINTSEDMPSETVALWVLITLCAQQFGSAEWTEHRK